MTEFQAHFLMAAAIVSAASLVGFILAWRSNKRRQEQRRADAVVREEARARNTFADRLAEGRPERVYTPPAPPSRVVLSKDKITAKPVSGGYRAPPRTRTGGGGSRRRSGYGSSDSTVGGYAAPSCSTGSGSSCSSGGSSCGGGGGGD